jgi:hypothetical protein
MGELKKHDLVDIKSADVGDKGAPSGIVFDPQTGKIAHAVPGKHDDTTAARKLLHGFDQTLSQLTFAFDFTESSQIKAPTFTPLDKASLVQRYLNTPKNVTANGSSESWNANVIHDPLAKTVEKIRRENPEIFQSTLQHKTFSNNTDGALEAKINESLAKQKNSASPKVIEEIKSNLLLKVQQTPVLNFTERSLDEAIKKETGGWRLLLRKAANEVTQLFENNKTNARNAASKPDVPAQKAAVATRETYRPKHSAQAQTIVAQLRKQSTAAIPPPPNAVKKQGRSQVTQI